VAISQDIPIYGDPGYAVLPVSGNTPFGYYDNDPVFQTDAPKWVVACAYKLGWPVMEIQLQYPNFYMAFEEAITIYGGELYNYQIAQNYMSFENTSTQTNLNNAVITPTLGTVLRIADTYGSEAGVGGPTPYYSGSIPIYCGQQFYDLESIASSSWGVTGSNDLEIKRVFWEAPPAIVRFFDPYAGTGTGIQSLMETFGFGQYSPGINFMLMPINFDVMTLQAIEFNDQIRRSNFSFNIVDNQLRVFPIPTFDTMMWVTYIKKSERNNPIYNNSTGSVSNISNVPYTQVQYSTLNGPAKNWIYEYGYALCQEILGRIRQTYNDQIPLAGDNPGVQGLNGTALIEKAVETKDKLITQLREMLVKASPQTQMEMQAQMGESIRGTLTGVPLPFFIG
jgi:hypothetical protein